MRGDVHKTFSDMNWRELGVGQIMTIQNAAGNCPPRHLYNNRRMSGAFRRRVTG